MQQVVARPDPERGSRLQPTIERQSGGAFLRSMAKLLRRYTVRNERLRVCETISLGGRRSVALIECDGQRFLAGMSAGGVETLVPLSDRAARQGELR